jgi:hypothetical protein
MGQLLKPQSNYFRDANWKELHVLTTHWKSDVDFYKDELRFLRELIDKYFIWLIEDNNLYKAQKLVIRLTDTEKELENILKAVVSHVKQIEKFITNEFVYSEVFFSDEHTRLENKMTAFMKLFRGLKKDIFAVTKEVIEGEKMNHLLSL